MTSVVKLVSYDLPALATLYEELTGRPTDLEAMRANHREMESNQDYILLGVKTENGDLVGSALGIVCRDIIDQCKPWMVVENVIVAGHARGQGVGKLLMNALEDIARSRGCSYINLTSSIKRPDAHHFYEAIGYADNLVKAFRKNL